MMLRVGERTAIAFFMSNLSEQVDAGSDPAGRGVSRHADARRGRVRAPKVPATSRTANLDGYPRAVTS